MQQFYEKIPTDVREAIKYWPVTNAASVDLGKQTPYDIYVDENIDLATSLEQLSISNPLLQPDSTYGLLDIIRETFNSPEIQNLYLRSDPALHGSRIRAKDTCYDDFLDELVKPHPSLIHSVNGKLSENKNNNDRYQPLLSYINDLQPQTRVDDEPKQYNSESVSIAVNHSKSDSVHHNKEHIAHTQHHKSKVPQQSIPDPDSINSDSDSDRPIVLIINKRRHSTDAKENVNKAKRAKFEDNTETISITTTAVAETASNPTAEQNTNNAPEHKNDRTEIKESISDETDVYDDIPHQIEQLEDLLSNIFDEDDALTENNETETKLFKVINHIHGNTVVLSRRTVRQFHSILQQCSSAIQLIMGVSEDSIGRFIRLLMHTVEAADKMDFAKLIKDGIGVSRESSLSNAFCEQFDIAISISSLGLDAASLIITIISLLSKQKASYSEDSLRSAIAFFKTCQLECTVPLLDLGADSKLALLFSNEDTHGRKMNLKYRLNSLLQALLEAHKPMSILLRTPLLVEQDIISVVFASIGVMFSSNTLPAEAVDSNMVESVRRASQLLLRYIFEYHVEQRSWVLEEILASLIKLPTSKRSHNVYRLAGGKSVQFITVLLLRLLQSSAQPNDDLAVGFETSSLTVKDYRMLEDRHRKLLESASSSTDFTIRYLIGRCIKRDSKSLSNEAEFRSLLDTFINDCIILLGHPQWPGSELVLRIYSLHMIDILDDEKAEFTIKAMAIDSVAQIASQIARTQNVHEDCVEKDNTATALETLTPKSSIESTRKYCTSTTTILGYLQQRITSDDSTGAIPLYVSGWACSLIPLLVKSQSKEKIDETTSDCVDGNTDTNGLNSSTKDQVSKSSLDISKGSHKHTRRIDSDSDESSSGGDDSDSDYESSANKANKKRPPRNQSNAQREADAERRQIIEECLKSYAKIIYQSTKVVTSNVSYISASEAAHAYTQQQPLYRSFNMLLTRVTMALSVGLVTLRSRALRALNQIASHRPSVLYQNNVKYAINHRLQDSSPQVREAAIDLIGRHVLQNPDLIDQYYEFISVRALDKGVSVRKRVMRILREIYIGTSSTERKVDIGIRLLHRTTDDERSVREYAYKTLQELWFTYNEEESFAVSSINNINGEGNHAEDSAVFGSSVNTFNMLSQHMQQLMMDRIKVVTGVMSATMSRDLPDLMNGLFEYVTNEVSEHESESALFVTRCFIDALFEQLLRAEEGGISEGDGAKAADEEVFSASSCLQFLSTLSQIAPNAVGYHAEMLSSYLKMTGSSEEDTLHNVLTIFNNSLLYIPHPSPQFLSALESDLISLLSSSPQAILTTAIPCLCTVIDKITKNYTKLIKLFRSCALQLYREQRSASSGAPIKSAKNTMRFMILAGLMCRYFEFDKHSDQHPELFKELNQLASEGTILEFMNKMFLFFASEKLSSQVQLAAIQMLGQLYIKNPRLALTVSARDAMNRVFNSGSSHSKLQVVRNFLEFLKEDAKRYVKLQKESKESDKVVDARALVGNSSDMGAAGVSASLMQTYLDSIISATFIPDSLLLRSTGFDVISLVLEQGLAHPLKCVPALIALSTDSDPRISNKALKLHQDLNTKYASFIHSRDIEGVRKAFDYQTQVRGGLYSVSGYNDSVELIDTSDRPFSYLQPLYTLLRTKRTRRNEFLSSLISAGDYDTSSIESGSEPDISFVRFIAESISALDFKHLEEVFHVAYKISTVVASTGLNLYQAFEAENVKPLQGKAVNRDGNGNAEPVPGAGTDKTKSGNDGGSPQWKRATEASVCVSILFLLREFLKRHYGLSESRCSGYAPGESSGARDKQVAWHPFGSDQGRINWNSCRYAIQPMDTIEAYKDQRKGFCRMISESLSVIDEHASMSSDNRSGGSFADSSMGSFIGDADNNLTNINILE